MTLSTELPYLEGYSPWKGQYKNPVDIKSVRHRIIEANFCYMERQLHSFISPIQRFCRISAGSIRQTYEKGQLWKAVAYAIYTIGLVVLVGAVAYFAFSYLLPLGFFAHFSLTKIGVGALCLGGIIFAISKLISNNPLLINYKSHCKTDRIYLQHLEDLSAHMGEITIGQDCSNLTEDGKGVEDAITYEMISEKEARMPKTVIISKSPYSVNTALSVMFKKSSRGGGAIPHPIYDQDLNEREKNKFINDLCFLFCLSDPKQLMACWDDQDIESKITDRSTIAQANQYYRKKELTQSQLKAFVRMQKFLNLIPQESHKYLNIRLERLI